MYSPRCLNISPDHQFVVSILACSSERGDASVAWLMIPSVVIWLGALFSSCSRDLAAILCILTRTGQLIWLRACIYQYCTRQTPCTIRKSRDGEKGVRKSPGIVIYGATPHLSQSTRVARVTCTCTLGQERSSAVYYRSRRLPSTLFLFSVTLSHCVSTVDSIYLCTVEATRRLRDEMN